MAYSKSERYQLMSELADDLRAVLEVRPVKARSPGPLLKLQKWSQRNLAYVMLAGLLLVILAIGFAISRAFTTKRRITTTAMESPSRMWTATA